MIEQVDMFLLPTDELERIAARPPAPIEPIVLVDGVPVTDPVEHARLLALQNFCQQCDRLERKHCPEHGYLADYARREAAGTIRPVHAPRYASVTPIATRTYGRVYLSHNIASCGRCGADPSAVDVDRDRFSWSHACVP